jgi:hypothetical protein
MPLISLYAITNDDDETKTVDIDCTLHLNDPQLTITAQYPQMNDATNNTWNGRVNNRGRINLTNNTRNYFQLFYEVRYPPNTIQFQQQKLQQTLQFIVRGNHVEKFLEKMITDCMKYNVKESNDYITFFLPQMEHNSYNLIQFLINDQIPWTSITINNVNNVKFIRSYLLFEEYSSLNTILNSHGVTNNDTNVYVNSDQSVKMIVVDDNSDYNSGELKLAFDSLSQDRQAASCDLLVTEWGGSRGNHILS